MPRGKALDIEIKNDLYEFAYSYKLFDKYPHVIDIMDFIKKAIQQYFSDNKQQMESVSSGLFISRDELQQIISEDVAFNMFEHIRILKIGFEEDDDEIENMHVLRLRNYLSEKYKPEEDKPEEDKLKKYKSFERRYKERLKEDRKNIKQKDSYGVVIYCMHNLSDIYHDYIFRFVYDEHHYVDKEYSQILDFFYGADKVANKNLRAYCIWDIDETWLPDIINMYSKCDNQSLHLIERLYHFIAAANIYGSRSMEEDICFSNAFQPLSMFGWGRTFKCVVERYKTKVLKYESYINIASFLFNALSYGLRNTLYGVLNKLKSLKTNETKFNYLYDLYKQYDGNLKYILIDTYNIYNDEKIKIANDIIIQKDFMEIYKCILFNAQLKIRVEKDLNYSLRSSQFNKSDNDYDEEDEEDVEDDDDDYDDEDGKLEDDSYDNETIAFDMNFSFKGRNPTLYDFYESMECLPDDEDDGLSFGDIHEQCLSFGFNDYLYMTIEYEYDDFYK